MIKKIAKKILPKKIIRLGNESIRMYKIRRNIKVDYSYDYEKFNRLSASYNLDNKDKMASFLIKEYHAIEKGMALSKPKPGFGIPRITQLLEVARQYIKLYGKDQVIKITIDTLKEYAELDKMINDGNYNPVISKINDLVTIEDDTSNLAQIGGSRQIKKEDVLKNLNFDFDSFFKSRHSVRDFSDVPVSETEVIEAIDVAKYTPSVCNRQPWKAYVIRHNNRELMNALLANQNGNKGFGDKISCLVVVTGKLSNFFSYERNQVFIDGGMFAMSILLALHSRGYGTCCLNLSYTASKNKAFDKIMNFDEDVVPIMYIAVGNLKDEFKVAISSRKEKDEIVSLH